MRTLPENKIIFCKKQILQKILEQVLSGCLLFLVLLQTGCMTSDPLHAEYHPKKRIHDKVFYQSYDRVWRAAQLALKYPIAVNNMDHGALESEFVKNEDGFVLPGVETQPSAGLRTKIVINMVKGKTEGRDSVRVVVQKIVQKQRDFFSEPETLKSDGFEEMVLFYRIERELIIDEALKKAAKVSQP
jgi:hypothetical protein